MFIYAYNYYSKSARLIAELLGARMIKHERSRFVGRPNKIVVNWGSSALPDEVIRSTVLNSAQRVAYMTNKLKFFELCKKAFRMPPHTTDQAQAERWRLTGHHVCARHILNGHSADGLILHSPRDRDAVGVAPLYTKYVNKKQEFRVHCIKLAQDVATFVQRKARRRDVPDGQVNWKIRNLDGGFVYSVVEECPEDVKTQALAAFKKTGLDFGAVDVIYNEEARKAYVLEVNTAPGLEQRTAEFYANNFSRRINALLYM